MITIYGLKNCDTCRKALRSLPGARLVDVRAEGLPEATLDAGLATFGVDMLNTRSTTWRALTETERQADPKALIRAHPAVMKRPLIAVDSMIFIGWNNKVEVELKALL